MERRPFRVDPQLLAFARELRHNAAPAEQNLWRCLRNRQLGGFKFRRQVAIDRYVADFYCAECGLVIELDGDSHFEPGADEKDAKRTQTLEAVGHEIIRFTNPEVFENLDGVLETILRACENQRRSTSGPSPRLSPEYGGEG